MQQPSFQCPPSPQRIAFDAVEGANRSNPAAGLCHSVPIFFTALSLAKILESP
jgi:hypothetical protein